MLIIVDNRVTNMKSHSLIHTACLALFCISSQAGAATLYSLGVDGDLPGSPSGSYLGTGDGLLDSGIMNYSHTGNILVDGGLEISVTYTGTFDLLAETGSVVASDCIYISGFANLCDSLIQDTLIPLNVTFVSAASGSPITVVADDGQGFFTHTFTQVVPIPAAVWLFASGLGLLGWFRHRAKKLKQSFVDWSLPPDCL